MDKVLDGKKRLYGRLSASVYDFGQAHFCARHLAKKGWHSKPWERRGTIYQQQTAYVTNLVVAYARPFVSSKGWPGFPQKLVSFTEDQMRMHRRLIRIRHEIFAHSDSAMYSFRPMVWGDVTTTIESRPMLNLSASDTDLVQVMTRALITSAQLRLKELHPQIAEVT